MEFDLVAAREESLNHAGQKIAILDDYQGVALASADWSGLGRDCDVTVFRDHLDDVAALAERLRPFTIVCAMRERTALGRELLQRLPALKLIVTTGTWNAAIDLEAARALGITVCGTQSQPHAAPELTWALILAAVRNLPAELASVEHGGWQVSVGGDLHGQTLGLLGLGRIGQSVAKVGLAFGMRVVAWSQNLTAASAEAHGAVLVGKEELFRGSDLLSIHLKLSDRTRGIVGAPELALMRPDAILINTSRGPLVDDAALVAALQEHRLSGAAIDVFEQEPLPEDHPLRSAPNTILTPHIGYVTRNTYRMFYEQVVDDIEQWRAGTPVRLLG